MNEKDIEKLYQSVKNNHEKKFGLQKLKLQDYDKRTEILYNDASAIVQKFCDFEYKSFIEDYKINKISYSDRSRPSFLKYNICKSYYTHDIFSYLKYNSSIVHYIFENYSNCMINCKEVIDKNNQNSERSSLIKKYESCIDSCFNTFIENTDFFINKNANVVLQKENYLLRIKQLHNII